MPWQASANLSDDDLKAIFAYLKSVPAVKNHVPEPVTPKHFAAE
jgi:cytochrome c553